METGDIRITFKCLGCGHVRWGVRGSMKHGLSRLYEENTYCDKCGGLFFSIAHEAAYGGDDGTSEVHRDEEYARRRETWLTENPQYQRPGSMPVLPDAKGIGLMHYYCACGHPWRNPDQSPADSDHCPACHAAIPPVTCPACQEEITVDRKELRFDSTWWLTHHRVEGACRSGHGFLFGFCTTQQHPTPEGYNEEEDP